MAFTAHSKKAFRHFAISTACATVIGWLFGAMLAGILIVPALYGVRSLYYAARMHAFLTDRVTALPDGDDLWHDIFYQLDKVYAHQQEHRKRLQKLVKQFTDVTKALPYSTVAINNDNDIIWVNVTAKKLLGLRGKDVGVRIEHVIRNAAFSRFLQQTDDNSTLKLPSPVNNKLMLAINSIRYQHDRRLLIARDISAQYANEQQLKQLIRDPLRQLETELAQLCADEHADRTVCQQAQQRVTTMLAALDNIVNNS